MAPIFDSLSDLSDDQLLSNLKALATDERHATARLIAALGELDRRELFLGQGCTSLFTYCTQVLHLSEHAAYNRIAAARAARRFPEILTLLADGAVTLTTVYLLAPLLNSNNHHELLVVASHKGKRDVEHLVAATRPQPDVSSIIRKLPSVHRRTSPPTPILNSCEAAAPAAALPVVAARTNLSEAEVAAPRRPGRPAVVAPLAPERYKVQFTASRETYDKLRRAQELLRHVIPNGDPAAVFDRALDSLLKDLERRKLAATTSPRTQQQEPSRSRHIPAAVRREVWQRDGARCAFVGSGRRCTERGFLELHHVVPFADGGQATVGNIELRCRAHNAYEADRYFGSFVLRERAPLYDSVRNELVIWHKIGAAAP
jgi:hypothetical protein